MAYCLNCKEHEGCMGFTTTPCVGHCKYYEPYDIIDRTIKPKPVEGVILKMSSSRQIENLLSLQSLLNTIIRRYVEGLLRGEDISVEEAKDELRLAIKSTLH